MADELTFVLKLRDEFTNAANKARDALRSLGDTGTSAGKSVGDGADQAKTKVRGLGDEMDKTSSKGFNFETAMKKIGSALGGLYVMDKIKDLANLGLQTASTQQQMSVAFTTLMKDSGRAKDEMAWLTKTAAATPFELKDLTAADRTLLGFGMTSDKVRRDFITGMGDMASAIGVTGSQFPEFARVFGQIHAAGKLQGQDMMQLVNYGVSFDTVAKRLNMSVPELRKAMEKGTITADMFEKAMKTAFTQDYAGGMDAMSKTFQGKLSTFKDNISLTLGQLFTPMLPFFGDVLDKVGQTFADWVGKVPVILSRLKSVWDEYLARPARDLGVAFEALWLDVLQPFFTKLAGTGAFGILGKAMKDADLDGTAKQIGKAMDDLNLAIAWIVDHKDAVTSALAGMTGAYTAWKTAVTVNNTIENVSGWIEKATAAWKAYKTANEGATIAQWLLNAAMSANPIMLVITLIAGLVAGLVYFFTQTETGQRAWATFTKFLGDAWKTVVEKIGQGKDWIVEHWNALWKKGEDTSKAISDFWHGVQQKWDDVKNAIGRGKDDIVGWWNGLTKSISDGVEKIKQTWSWITSPEGAHAIGFAIGKAVGQIVKWFEDLPGLIGNGLTTARDWIVQHFEEARLWAGQKLTDFGNAALTFFQNLPGMISGAISAARDWIVNKFGEAKDWAIDKFNQLVTWVTGLPAKIGDALKALPTWLHDHLIKPFEDAYNFVKGKWDAMAGWLSGLAGGAAQGYQAGHDGTGDTPTSVGRGNLGNTLAAYRAMGSGLGISNVFVGGGGRGYGSGDHQAGRALDLVGPLSRMESFVTKARMAGDYAAMHGSGAGRHVHYVPLNAYGSGPSKVELVAGGMGDTPVSVRGGGSSVTIAPGAIVVNGITDPRAAASHALALLERKMANAAERR